MKKDIPEVEVIKKEYKSIEKYSSDFYKEDMREFKIISVVLFAIAIIIFILSLK